MIKKVIVVIFLTIPLAYALILEEEIKLTGIDSFTGTFDIPTSNTLKFNQIKFDFLKPHDCEERDSIDIQYTTSDGRLTITGSIDGTIRIWDLLDENRPYTLKHTSPITAITMTPKGEWALAGTAAGDVILFSVEDINSKPFILRGHSNQIACVALNSDATCAVTTAQNESDARVWNLEDKKKISALLLTGDKKTITSAALGQYVLICYSDKTAKLWDIRNLHRMPRLHTISGNPGRTATITSDGTWAAIAGSDAIVRLFDLRNPEAIKYHELKGHTKLVTSLCFSENGAWLMSGSRDRTARVWNLTKLGFPSCTLGHHDDYVTSVHITDDGMGAITGSDTTAKVWDLQTFDWDLLNLEQISSFPLEGHTRLLYDVFLFPDRKRALTAAHDHLVKIWNLTTEPKPSPVDLLAVAVAAASFEEASPVSASSSIRPIYQA